MGRGMVSLCGNVPARKRNEFTAPKRFAGYQLKSYPLASGASKRGKLALMLNVPDLECQLQGGDLHRLVEVGVKSKPLKEVPVG